MFTPWSILTVADDGSKQRYINNETWSDKKGEFQGKQNFQKKKDIIIVKKLNSRSHLKFPAAILM